jgi:rRNA maturation RNase YbeY
MEWIYKVIQCENHKAGDLNIIFCSDSYLLQMNRDYLNHDFLTDIITFDNSDNHLIAGDLFISIDRVTENASSLIINFVDELHRVIIHGVLHLLGYDDKDAFSILVMREREDFYLNLRNF